MTTAIEPAVSGAPRSRDRRNGGRVRAGLLSLAFVVAGCGSSLPGLGDIPGVTAFPTPSCGGERIFIDGMLDCDTLVGLAIGALEARVPEQLDRGVVSIDVRLGDCPVGELPRQVQCGPHRQAQFVTVKFPAPVEGGPIEPSLTVALSPVEGTVLGIINPLIR